MSVYVVSVLVCACARVPVCVCLCVSVCSFLFFRWNTAVGGRWPDDTTILTLNGFYSSMDLRRCMLVAR